jgi:hypothetical protein
MLGGMRYSVAIAVEILERPPREVAESARNLGRLAEMLPAGTHLRELVLPETVGVVEIVVDLDASGPAEALHRLNLAAELVAVYAGGAESLGDLHHATVQRHTTDPSAAASVEASAQVSAPDDGRGGPPGDTRRPHPVGGAVPWFRGVLSLVTHVPGHTFGFTSGRLDG